MITAISSLPAVSEVLAGVSSLDSLRFKSGKLQGVDSVQSVRVEGMRKVMLVGCKV